MGEPQTFSDCVQELASALSSACDTSDVLQKIDWTNVKAMIAKLLENFGPLLIQILIGFLNPPAPTPKS